MLKALFPILLVDVANHLTSEDKKYFVQSREKMFGTKLENVSWCHYATVKRLSGAAAADDRTHMLYETASAWAMCVYCQMRSASVSLQVVCDVAEKVQAFRTVLEPMRQTLKQFKWLGGDRISYAGISVAGNFLVSCVPSMINVTCSNVPAADAVQIYVSICDDISAMLFYAANQPATAAVTLLLNVRHVGLCMSLIVCD